VLFQPNDLHHRYAWAGGPSVWTSWAWAPQRLSGANVAGDVIRVRPGSVSGGHRIRSGVGGAVKVSFPDTQGNWPKFHLAYSVTADGHASVPATYDGSANTSRPWTLPVPLEPGSHTLKVRPKGSTTWTTTTVDVVAGDTTVATATLPAVITAESTPLEPLDWSKDDFAVYDHSWSQFDGSVIGNEVGIDDFDWWDFQKSVSGQPASLLAVTYAWKRDGVTIPGAAGSDASHTITAADLGHDLSLTVTGSIPGYDDHVIELGPVHVPTATSSSTVAISRHHARFGNTGDVTVAFRVHSTDPSLLSGTMVFDEGCINLQADDEIRCDEWKSRKMAIAPGATTTTVRLPARLVGTERICGWFKPAAKVGTKVPSTHACTSFKVRPRPSQRTTIRLSHTHVRHGHSVKAHVCVRARHTTARSIRGWVAIMPGNLASVDLHGKRCGTIRIDGSSMRRGRHALHATFTPNGIGDVLLSAAKGSRSRSVTLHVR